MYIHTHLRTHTHACIQNIVYGRIRHTRDLYIFTHDICEWVMAHIYAYINIAYPIIYHTWNVRCYTYDISFHCCIHTRSTCTDRWIHIIHTREMDVATHMIYYVIYAYTRLAGAGHECRVMAHIWMSHGTHMNEPRHTYEWVMAHIWMSHGTHMNEPRRTHKWVMAHLWMSHGAPIDESWHTYEWVMSRIQVLDKNAEKLLFSFHSQYEWVMSHIWRSHFTHAGARYEYRTASLLVPLAMWMSHVPRMKESCHTCRC